MKYDFDEPIDRRGTICEKYDNLDAVFGASDILPLWVADTDFKTPEFITEAIKRRLDHPIFGYSFRCDHYYDSIREWLHRRSGWNVEREWLDFTPGVVCGLAYAVQSLSEVGDKVVIQPPVYPPFARTIIANGREVVNNPLKIVNDRYEIDFEDLDIKLQGASLFILCNPHNPTGRVFSYNELKQIGELCIKHNVKIASDEIHSDLILSSHKHTHIASISKEIADITLTYVAPSKTFNIAGLSTAVAIIPSESIRKKYCDTACKIHADQGNIFGAVALRAAYENGDEWLDELMIYIENNIDYVIDFLKTNTPKIKCIKPESTFLLWLDCQDMGLSQNELCDFFIHKAKLGLNNGADFGVEGERFVRLNVGTQHSVLKTAMEQLLNAYNKL